ncbi:MAG: choice-of-anchor D domain-containing protein, partial [Planctomycetes bacterium]|nr:choice-of-anchor D domain-containing protein [Planctomycetota bacterium]
ADGTDFGSAAPGDPALQRTFTVRNDGGQTLTLGAMNLPGSFSLSEGLAASLAPGTEDTFTVQLDTATEGTFGGQISFSNNDDDEDPFDFAIAGTVRALPGDAVNFNDFTIDPFDGSSDVTGPVTVEDGGATLHIVGNRWKKIDFAHTITSESILEFDFKSTVEGEVHGIGLDNTLTKDFFRTFQVYGTQSWGVGDFNNYTPSGYQHYTIPLGPYYTGAMKYLYFANDHDVSNPTGESYFSNVRVYDPGAAVPAVSAAAVLAADDLDGLARGRLWALMAHGQGTGSNHSSTGPKALSAIQAFDAYYRDLANRRS